MIAARFMAGIGASAESAVRSNSVIFIEIELTWVDWIPCSKWHVEARTTWVVFFDWDSHPPFRLCYWPYPCWCDYAIHDMEVAILDCGFPRTKQCHPKLKSITGLNIRLCSHHHWISYFQRIFRRKDPRTKSLKTARVNERFKLHNWSRKSEPKFVSEVKDQLVSPISTPYLATNITTTASFSSLQLRNVIHHTFYLCIGLYRSIWSKCPLQWFSLYCYCNGKHTRYSGWSSYDGSALGISQEAGWWCYGTWVPCSTHGIWLCVHPNRIMLVWLECAMQAACKQLPFIFPSFQQLHLKPMRVCFSIHQKQAPY